MTILCHQEQVGLQTAFNMLICAVAAAVAIAFVVAVAATDCNSLPICWI